MEHLALMEQMIGPLSAGLASSLSVSNFCKQRIPVACLCRCQWLKLAASSSPAASSCAPMAPLTALVLGAILSQARAWECPTGFAGPEQCLGKENTGKCDLQKPTAVDVDTSSTLTCQSPDTKLVEFENDWGLGSGSYYKGCGLQHAGLEDSCCNCWPLAQATEVSVGSEASETKSQCFPCHNSCCKWWWLCIFERCLFEGDDCSHAQC
ncbi:Gcsh [Symbiodinium natans]|uniref:Gcsh protein n=1 Tax=Symbiodinium natans TaxID=878477 RepID=A0A812G9X4_9DINO|nr:Gcsh [Symbiodinium natans]